MTLLAGSITEIDATISELSTDCDRISDTQMLVIYRDSSGVLGARVCDITTSTKSILVNAQSSLTFGFNMTELSMARFSSTKFIFGAARGVRAAVLNVSGTTTTIGPIFTFTDTPNQNISRMKPLTSTTSLWSYGTGSDIYARVLSIDGSDNISEGSRVTIATASTQINVYDVVIFSSTKAAIFWQDDTSSNYYLKAQLLSISGSTITLDGSVQTIYSTKQGWNGGVSAAALSSSEAFVAHDIVASGGATYGVACHIVSLSGSTLTPGTTLEIPEAQVTPGGSYLEPSQAIFTNDTTVLICGGSTSYTGVNQIIKSATTLSYTTGDKIEISLTGARNYFDSIKKVVDDYALVVTRGTVDGTVLGSDSVTINYDLVLGGGQP